MSVYIFNHKVSQNAKELKSALAWRSVPRRLGSSDSIFKSWLSSLHAGHDTVFLLPCGLAKGAKWS